MRLYIKILSFLKELQLAQFRKGFFRTVINANRKALNPTGILITSTPLESPFITIEHVINNMSDKINRIFF